VVTGMTALDLAMVLTRVWTRVYTSRLPAVVADERRAEVECDLWEMRHDPTVSAGMRGALIAFARLVDGVADDVAWRVEQAPIERQLLLRRMVALVAAVVLVTGLWSISSLFAGGARNVDACASQAPAPETGADLRVEVVRCAGAFFLARD
jgi:hypothetical protein